MPFIVTTKRPVAPDEHGQPFCATCSHYHEGACLCPDCGRPTPCRDHYAAASVSTPATETLVRLAVATLEEAHERYHEVLYVAGLEPPAAEWQRRADEFEVGKSVGPLPDGRLIKVEEGYWYHLAAEAGHPWADDTSRHTSTPDEATQNEIIAAYNAKQAQP